MQSEIFSNTYSEELYLVPSKPVVVLSIGWDKVSEKEKTLLEKILSAVKLSLSHVKIVCNAQPDVLQWIDKPKHVMVFGSEIPGLTKNDLLEVQGTKLIITSSLDALEADTEAKKKLWNSLRQMFSH